MTSSAGATPSVPVVPLAAELAALTAAWDRRRPGCPPLAERLKAHFPQMWVRFHSLPGSRRYPRDETEYAILLDRYDTVLDTLFAGMDVYVITATFSAAPEPEPAPPGAPVAYWRSVPQTDDPDYSTYRHLSVSRHAWRRGGLHPLLRDTADDLTFGVMITDTELRRLHHPYDGGADVFMETTAERDELAARHAAWLSSHPSGR